MKTTIMLAVVAGCLARAADPVGLSLNFRNGQMAPIPLTGSAPRYLQEVDIVATSAPILILLSGATMASEQTPVGAEITAPPDSRPVGREPSA